MALNEPAEQRRARGLKQRLAPYRTRIALAAAVVGALALTGAVLWSMGSDQRALEDACAGTLAIPETRSVVGDGAVSVSSSVQGTFGSGRGTTLLAHCTVSGDGGTVDVKIAGAPRPQREYGIGELYAAVPASHILPVPIGHGWSGLLGTDNTRIGDGEDGKATASVVLACAQGGRSLLITVESEATDGATLDDPATRPRFTATATATARAANGHWKCGAHLGKAVHTVPLPVNEDEYQPLSDADGTCAGVPGGSQYAVTTARETARGGPRETCAVGSREGSPRYRLDAYYGPYAEEARAQYLRDFDYENITPADKPSGRLGESAYWASAGCPGQGDHALYMVVVDGLGQEARRSPDLPYERAALKTFAERSAREHGCSAPATP